MVTDADRLVSKARTASRRAVADLLGGATASGNLAADQIADAVVSAIGYRDPNEWPSKEAVAETLRRMR